MKCPWLCGTHLSKANLCGGGEPLSVLAAQGWTHSSQLKSVQLRWPVPSVKLSLNKDLVSAGAALRNSQEEKGQWLLSGEFALGLLSSFLD